MGYCGNMINLQFKNLDEVIAKFWLSTFPYYEMGKASQLYTRTVNINRLFKKYDIKQIKKLYAN